MKIILKSAGEAAKSLLPLLEHNSDFEVIGFTDKNCKMIGKVQGGYPTFSVFECVRKYKNGEAEAFVISYKVKVDLLKRMVEELTVLGISADDIYIAVPEFYENPTKENLCRWSEYTCLRYFEYHVADHCNLNCKGCVHFSPLVNGEVFSDFEVVKSDLIQLKKLVKYVESIHILGGEPLLNKELPEYLRLTREIYPYAEIAIVSNGLLIRQMSRKLIDSIKEAHVSIFISLYRPMFENMISIVDFLQEQEIDYTYSDPMEKFAYTFDDRGGLAKGVEMLSCWCPNLYRGKLYICPIIAYGQYYNSAFGSYINLEEGAIDIYDSKLTYEELNRLLHNVVPLCDKCLYVSQEKKKWFAWERTSGINNLDYVLP